MAGKHLILVGLMGAGKTTVGRCCAERLGRDFVDTDDLVIMRAGMPVDDIFATGGEAQFRSLEREVIADVCASPARLVVACGGGSVIDPENRRQLRNAGVVIWLRASVAVLAARVGDGGALVPSLRTARPRRSRVSTACREPLYEGVADCAIETDGIDADAVADAVVAAYEGVRA